MNFSIDCENNAESLHSVFDSSYITFWKDKTMEIIKRSVVARDCKEGEMNRQNAENFKVSESILHDNKNGGTCSYTFV